MNIAPEWTDAPSPPPQPADQAALALCWERWRESAARSEDADLIAFAAACQDDPAASALLGALFGNSRYLSHCLIADQGFARLLIESGPEAACAAARAMAADRSALGTESRADVMKRLRVAKRRASLAIGMADVASVWPLERVTGALSDIASATLDAVCAHLLRALHDRGKLALPDPQTPVQGSGLIILGMGKLGAGELNYSSDVDIIVLFDEDVASDPGGDGLQQIFARLARNLVTIMDERTADGYVFRTDLRLRPDPGSTAAALSVRAAEAYYATTGENWERAAMIKAKPVAGDIEAGTGFLERLQPFVWRRHLDFAAIQNIRAIKRQIDAHRGLGEIAVAGHNIKLGRGGIREIEFLAQTQQLIWGGRDPALRVRGTGEAFDRLVAAGHMRRRAVTELMATYRFHRRVEHRLQMADDRQTHSLPDDEAGVAAVATFLGFETRDAFADALLAHLQTVERHYATLFEDEPALTTAGTLDFGADGDGDATLETLSALGYAHPERAFETLRAWHEGRYRAMRSEEARERLAELVPKILEVLAAWPDPDSALALFDGFLSRLPAGSHLFSMFAARPALFDLVTEIMGSAPRLAGWLEHRPVLLDSVLSREFSDLDVPGAEELGPELATIARRGLVRVFYQREFGAAEMKAELADLARRARDVQDFLDASRRWANDKIFHIGVHMLRGLLFPVEAAKPLSDIADACLGATLSVVADAYAAAHGRIPGGRLAVVALGRLGSRRMTVGTALELMLVYDHAPGAAQAGTAQAGTVQSDGRRPLEPGRYYGQLGRRFVAAIGAATAEGTLYDVDMRPQPLGQCGAGRHLARGLLRALPRGRRDLAASGTRACQGGPGRGRSRRALRGGAPHGPRAGRQRRRPRRRIRAQSRTDAGRGDGRGHLGDRAEARRPDRRGVHRAIPASAARRRGRGRSRRRFRRGLRGRRQPGADRARDRARARRRGDALAQPARHPQPDGGGALRRGDRAAGAARRHRPRLRHERRRLRSRRRCGKPQPAPQGTTIGCWAVARAERRPATHEGMTVGRTGPRSGPATKG